MTKKQRIEHKAGNQLRKDKLIRLSKGKPLGENALIFLGGVGQDSKYARAGRSWSATP